MDVWIDALTSKQGTLLAHVALRLINEGFKVFMTCREYELTCDSINRLGLEPYVVGRYAEGDLLNKLQADSERISKLATLVRDVNPKALIAYPNPSASRVAFGLKIPYIALTDSPHAEIPSRLSLPLASHVIFSSCIDRHSISRYVFQEKCNILQYNGVDELIWIKHGRPSDEVLALYGVERFSYVVVRPQESYASYYLRQPNVDIVDVIKLINSYDLTVVFIPRYSTHYELFRKLVDKGLKIKLITRGYDGLSLTYYAFMVITGGGTLAREASLLGTPAITFFPQKLEVNECVRKWGFPLFSVSDYETLSKLINDIVDNYVKYRIPYGKVMEIISKLEDPYPYIKKALEEV